MGCLYCGKEIGTFKLLRGNEFCSDAHRNHYSARLNRALQEMAAPERAPAAVAGCVVRWHAKDGVSVPVSSRWAFGNGRTAAGENVTLQKFVMTLAPDVDHPADKPRVPGESPRLGNEPPLLHDEPPGFDDGLPLHGEWMPSPQAEPVARMVQTCFAAVSGPAVARPAERPRVPLFRVAADLATAVPLASHQIRRRFAPEPAARMVSSICADNLAGAVRGPVFSIDMQTARRVPPLGGLLPVPPAEPVARFMASVIAPALGSLAGLGSPAATVRVPGADLAVKQVAGPPTAHVFAVEAEPAARLVGQSVACHLIPTSARTELRLPVFDLPPAFDSAEELLEACMEPPACQTWMRVPEPAPAASLVRWAMAGEALTGITPQLAVLGLSISRPRVPTAAKLMAAPAAELVMAGVQPRLASASLSLLSANTGSSETWLPGAMNPVEGPAQVPGLRLAGLASTARAKAVESPLASTAAAPAVSAGIGPAARMGPFNIQASAIQNTPGFEKQELSPAPPAPKLPRDIGVLQPIGTIESTGPAFETRQPVPAIVQPEFIPVEYHVQRLRGECKYRLEWQTPRPAAVPPRFAVRPLLDRLDSEVKPSKPVRKEPASGEVFTMPEARKKSQPWGLAGKAIAAGLVVAGMWLGGGVARLSRPSLASNQGRGASALASARAAGEAGGTANRGPVARVLQAISGRATYQAGDNFHDGMPAWGATAKSYAQGWERDHSGYVRPGALALFSPSLKFKDYRFEFFGQVETKSMGWVVRAADTNNYYAMKFKVLEGGLRPVIAMVHYPVIGGKPGRKVETPLSVMVHNNRPFQVAVNVKGSRFVASINGEEVDSWSDSTLKSGGVGFFAEAGERARLYWMKVVKNDDWLGHVCSMLAGSGSEVTSGWWGPGFDGGLPGGIPRPSFPAPGAPADSSGVTLAAAVLGLPFPTRRPRESKNRRYQPWSC